MIANMATNSFDNDLKENDEIDTIIKKTNLLQMNRYNKLVFEILVYKNSFVQAKLINDDYSTSLVLPTNFIEFWISNINLKNKIEFCKSLKVHNDECFMIKECQIMISDFRLSNKTDIVYQKVQGSDRGEVFHIPISKHKYHANKNNSIGSKIKIENIVNSECCDKTMENVFDLYENADVIPTNSYIQEVLTPRPIWISDFELSDNHVHQLPQIGNYCTNFKIINFTKSIDNKKWIPDVLRFSVLENSELVFYMQQKTTVLVANKFNVLNFDDIIASIDTINVPITHRNFKDLNPLK